MDLFLEQLLSRHAFLSSFSSDSATDPLPPTSHHITLHSHLFATNLVFLRPHEHFSPILFPISQSPFSLIQSFLPFPHPVSLHYTTRRRLLPHAYPVERGGSTILQFRFLAFQTLLPIRLGIYSNFVGSDTTYLFIENVYSSRAFRDDSKRF